MEQIRYLTAGDAAVVVEFGDRIEEKVNERVRALADSLEQDPMPGVVDRIPTFRSLMVCFDPEKITQQELNQRLAKRCESLSTKTQVQKRVIEIPVCYGARFGMDLKDVSAHTGLTYDEVIELHAGRDYRIYMLGFLPGFSYLGGMDARLVTPRLSNPRVKIPAGSVGIGGEQTGIYPLDSPGGWRLIGATPVRTYDPDREEPILFSAGEYLRFVPVSLFDYYDIRRLVEQGKYFCRVFENGKEAPGRLAGVSEEEAASRLQNAKMQIEKPYTKKSQTTAELSFRVELPGMMTTIQDKGRIGYQQYGFTVSGAMDQSSLAFANALVGNSASAAALECTMLGPTLKAETDLKIAVTGADMQPRVNDRPIPMNEAVLVKAGDTITLGMAVCGVRAYFAVAGGIDVPKKMGSRSTHMKCQIGGLDGRKLAAGDHLPIGNDQETYDRDQLDRLQRISVEAVEDSRQTEVTLRVVPGPQEEYFTEQGRRNFYEQVYQLTGDCDRMGDKLEGPAVEAAHGVDIISDGIAFGAVQIPPSGKPIIMLADRQTTGGYAKIGTIAEADLPKLVQLRPGAKIRFQRTGRK